MPNAERRQFTFIDFYSAPVVSVGGIPISGPQEFVGEISMHS